MNLVCIRTVFFNSPSDRKTKWTRNKTYIFRKPKEFESPYLYGYMETDMIMEKDHHETKAGETYYSPLSQKELSKYFITIEEYRNIKIEHILNNKQ